MKTVFFDIDSQLDFLFPTGALYVPGGEQIVATIARLNQFAARHGIPVVSTTDAHAEDDAEFRVWPRHCVAGTLGQRKAEATLLTHRVVVPNRESAPEIAGAQQIIVEKQTVDMFETRHFARIVEALDADRHVLYGVVTEICVLFAARGLLQTGKPLAVVTDGIRELKSEDSRRALEEITAAGGQLVTAAETCAG